MRVFELEAPVKFVNSRHEWNGDDHGKLFLIDQRGLEWPFILRGEKERGGMRLRWWPSTSVEGDDVATRIERYEERYGDIGVDAALTKALISAIIRFVRSHPEESVFLIDNQGHGRLLPLKSLPFVKSLGVRVEQLPNGLKLTRYSG